MKEFATPNKHYPIAPIPDDGFGKEVIPDKMPKHA